MVRDPMVIVCPPTFQDKIVITIEVNYRYTAALILYNRKGRIVHLELWEIKPGFNKGAITPAKLPLGNYRLLIKDLSGMVIAKFLLSRIKIKTL